MSRPRPAPEQDRAASGLRPWRRVGLILLLLGLSVLVAVLADAALRRGSTGLIDETSDADAPAASAKVPPPTAPPTAVSTPEAKAPPALFQRSTWGRFSLKETVLAPDGGFVVTGTFTETVLFAPGTPEATLKKTARDGQTSGFVASFSAQRRLRWVRLVHGTVGITHVRVLPEGSVAITCRAGPRTQIEAGEDTLHETPPVQEGDHSSQFHVIRWDASGTLSWIRSFAAPVEAQDHGLEALPDGGVLVWGLVWKKLKMYPLEQGGVLEAPVNSQIIGGMIRIAPDGTKRWMRLIDWQEPLVGKVSTVLPDGTLVLAGAESQRVFLIWVRPEDGETERVVFGRSVELPGPPPSWEPFYKQANAYPVHLTALPDGSLALAAYFAGGFVVDERLPDFSTLQAGGPIDLGLALFSRSGALRWARVSGGLRADATMSEHLRADAEGVHVYGTALGPVTFSRGKADARTWDSPLPGKYRASYGADGTLEALEPSPGPPPGPLKEDCCQRTSWLSLRKERTLPTRNPPHAPELQAWLDRALGKVELGWTPEDKLGGLLEPGAEDMTQGSTPSWGLSSLALPGGDYPLLRSLQVDRALAMYVVLKTIPTDPVVPTQEDVRRAFAQLPRQEAELTDQYCHLPGHPGVVMKAIYNSYGRLLELWLGAFERQSCATR